jgi:hypothetical protein
MNEELYEEARKAIENLFSDMSVSKRETVKNLNSLIGDIEVFITVLQSEIDREEN